MTCLPPSQNIHIHTNIYIYRYCPKPAAVRMSYGARVLVSEHEGTRVLVSGHEGPRVLVSGLVPGYEGISVGISAGVRGY